MMRFWGLSADLQGNIFICPLEFQTRPSRGLTFDLVVYECEVLSLSSSYTFVQDPPKVSPSSKTQKSLWDLACKVSLNTGSPLSIISSNWSVIQSQVNFRILSDDYQFLLFVGKWLNNINERRFQLLQDCHVFMYTITPVHKWYLHYCIFT